MGQDLRGADLVKPGRPGDPPRGDAQTGESSQAAEGTSENEAAEDKAAEENNEETSGEDEDPEKEETEGDSDSEEDHVHSYEDVWDWDLDAGPVSAVVLEESAGNVEALDVVIEEDDETITVDLLLDKFSAVAAGVESDESGVAAASESDAAKTTRTVAEDGTALTAETVDGVDTYTVTKTSGLTVSYYNSIDAEDMVDSFGALITNNRYWSQIKSLLSLSDSSTGWEILKKCYSYITDDTYVCLNYIFSDGIDLDEVDLEDLAGSISLESSLFTFSGDADDLSIDTSTNTLTITCWWNSSGAKKAVSNDDLGEMTRTGFGPSL